MARNTIDFLLEQIDDVYVRENFRRIRAYLNDLTGDGISGTINNTILSGGATITGNGNVVITNVNCDASVYVGAAVRMNNFAVAFNALADTVNNSNVIGICQSKSSATKCEVRVTGVTPAIFAGLDTAKEYYLSDTVAGAIQTTPPTASGSFVVKLGQPFSSTELLVMKGLRLGRA